MDSRFVLITGASSGIGKAFAHKYASMGLNVILVARTEQSLSDTAKEIVKKYKVDADIISADLSTEEGIRGVEEAIKRYRSISVLVNSAGFALRKSFMEQDTAKQMNMINLHIVCSTRLVKAVIPQMMEHSQGTIINVSSLLSFMELNNNVVHCATKAYLNRFSQNLQRELKKYNIKVQALNPGYTLSNFHNTEEFAGVEKNYPKAFIMTAEALVDKAVKALTGSRVVYIPGFANKILVTFRALFSPILRKSLVSNRSVTSLAA